jgi:F-type H+-transporting ATPase subunit gamma
MAKARAIVKRRKAVRNIKKITKTMQMIATAKFQKALKRAVATKPYTRKVRELVAEVVANIGDVDHALLRGPGSKGASGQIAVVVLSSNRGLAGAYNGSVLRAATHFMRDQEGHGKKIELWVAGKKGVNAFNFQRRPIAKRLEARDAPRFEDIEPIANELMNAFIDGKLDAVYVAYMNFISAGQQKPDVVQLLPLSGIASAPSGDTKGAAKSSAPVSTKAGTPVSTLRTIYEFLPDPKTLLDELLPLTVKAMLFQAFLDATTSENVARMVAMKAATDNADKMVKSLTMQYNRARQSQITTELSEIMGGVEAMKA